MGGSMNAGPRGFGPENNLRWAAFIWTCSSTTSFHIHKFLYVNMRLPMLVKVSGFSAPNSFHSTSKGTMSERPIFEHCNP